MALSSSECYPCQTGFGPENVSILEPASALIRSAMLRFDYPLPYGAIVHEGGVQFVVFSRSATAMRVLFYRDPNSPDPCEVVAFDPELNRWGDVWSLFVPGIKPGQLYHFQADGPYEPNKGQRFDSKARLIDPYARALAGCFLPADGGIVRPPRCVVVDDTFDWQGDRHLRRPMSETVIYEMHVRGFTECQTSRVEHPGTYLGVIEKIPYLQSLGVTAVELMPVLEFPILDWNGCEPNRRNYWGYDPLAFFAPHRGYAYSKEPGAQVREFKEMVLALHQAGIEVIIDIVLNHTAEGNERGPTLSFKGLENRVYYMLENGGRTYRNYSGCGNTVNGNHPIVRELIFNCLRHWVHNYHIDGFRFDLASILSRDREGNLVPNPPVVESIGEDPLLADSKIIAEAWDAAGAYQVGTFGSQRWAEWNGRYRDDLRQFWRGDPRMIGPMATRMAGSSDLYQPSGRRPYHSVNFITAHDGFTLSDLVSYNRKHNEANDEANRDGDNTNYSFNYGVEGPTWHKGIEQIRQRQIKNMLASLLLSQGVPMIQAGDEIRRTQRGNNNAYCQDNEISWVDWRLMRRHQGLHRFVQTLIAFRRAEPTVRQWNFLTGRSLRPDGLPDLGWFNADGWPMDWQRDDRCLVAFLAAVRSEPPAGPNHHLLMLFHAGTEPRQFTLPELVRSIAWKLFLNTAAKSPDDVFPMLDGPPPPLGGRMMLESRSLVCYVAPDRA
jgi:glycogen operon protein